MGLTIKSVCWTTGKYDMILTMEGREEALMTSLLQLVARGNVRTQTPRAFNSEEMMGIASKIS